MLPAAEPAARPGTPGATPPILTVDGVEAVYGDVVLVLRGASLRVGAGQIVTLLGANGAGKTTLLRAVSGLLGVHRGKVTKGSIAFDGRSTAGADAASLVRSGMSQVMEGRRIFAELTVEENLRAGAFTVRSKAAFRTAEERVLTLFPVLAERRKATAGYLSGGEQQMVAMARALMQSPRLLLLDEPSLGLAPKIIEQIGRIIQQINEEGTSVLLVEQNAAMALSVAHHGYVLEHGHIVKDGTGPDLAADPMIKELYLGVGDAGRRSFRDVREHRRNKAG